MAKILKPGTEVKFIGNMNYYPFPVPTVSTGDHGAISEEYTETTYAVNMFNGESVILYKEDLEVIYD